VYPVCHQLCVLHTEAHGRLKLDCSPRGFLCWPRYALSVKQERIFLLAPLKVMLRFIWKSLSPQSAH
jgi:hypothetical protein